MHKLIIYKKLFPISASMKVTCVLVPDKMSEKEHQPICQPEIGMPEWQLFSKSHNSHQT